MNIRTTLVAVGLLALAASLSLAGTEVSYTVTTRGAKEVKTTNATSASQGAFFRWTQDGAVSVRSLESDQTLSWKENGKLYSSVSTPAYVLSSYLRRYDVLSGGAVTAARKQDSDAESAQALQTLMGLGVSFASGDWLGAVTALLSSQDQGKAAAAQQSVREIIDLHLEMSNDGVLVCGKTTSLLKVYGPSNMTLKSFRVYKVGSSTLSQGQLTRLVSQMEGSPAASSDMEAWRAFLTDGYVWLSSEDPAYHQSVRATGIRDGIDFSDAEFEVPTGALVYDGRGAISVGSWKNWYVDGEEQVCPAFAQASARSGQRIRGGLTLKCSGGSRSANLVIKSKYWSTGEEIQKKRIERVIEMTDGSSRDFWVEATLLKAQTPYRRELYLEVSLDGQVVATSPSDYRIVCYFTQ